MKRQFESERLELIHRASKGQEYWTEERTASLPEAAARHLRRAGWIGKPVIWEADIIWKESFIRLAPGKPWTQLETKQYLSMVEPARTAYMRTKRMPLEVRDLFMDGSGRMDGRFLKVIPAFRTSGPELSQGALLTIFAEALLLPALFLHPGIKWLEPTAHGIKVALSHAGLHVTGTFSADESGLFSRFDSEDRPYKEKDGTYRLRPFTAEVESWQTQGPLTIPKAIRIMWHLDSGAYDYYKGTIETIQEAHPG
ncbi:DUF6544 family protein [Alkalicoccus luteus]|uniref:Uncharacterized protein n=1 Tax=Alkalicoccus luteus TaxID=1237094 RepID=A0A969TU81_9BACI|nr:DUF6544 family protein [Alkalicoccus luteus]NJP38438.1 hypothetical protein [Alkalicoccus luteus]